MTRYEKRVVLSFIFLLFFVISSLLILDRSSITGNAVYDTPSVLFGPGVDSSYYDYDDVLLVCNPESSLSIQICNYYMSNRTTLVHVLNLTGSIWTSDSADATNYLSILNQIRGYINSTNSTINYIVLTKGIPIKSDYRNSTGSYSVDSMLAYDLRNSSAYRNYNGSEEPFSSSKFGFYIITRLDGYDYNDVKGLIDRGTIANRPENVKRDGKFILDEGWFPNAPRTDFEYTYTSLNSNGYNVIHWSNLSSTDAFLRNATNVSGYSSWISNDGAYYLRWYANYNFSAWENDNKPENWTVISGGVSKYSSYAEAFATGITEITQNLSSDLIREKSAYMDFRTSYTNFIGNAVAGLRGYNSSGSLIYSDNKTIVSSTSGANASLWYDGISTNLRYYPNQSIAKLEFYLRVNLTSGKFYIREGHIYELSPNFDWLNGAIGIGAVSYSARSFSRTEGYTREYGGQSLIADLINDGITGIEGFVSEPTLSAVANSSVLYDRYAKGYNLGDSFYMASSNLNWKDIIIGDPKMVITKSDFNSSISLVNLTNGADLQKGDLINLTITNGVYEIIAVNYTYNNFSSMTNYSLNLFNPTVNTSNFSFGNFSLTFYMFDSNNQSGWRIFNFTIIQNVSNASSSSNVTNSTNQSVSVTPSVTSSSGSSGGGGGGGGTTTTSSGIFFVTGEQIKSGYSKMLLASESLNFVLNGKNLSVKVNGFDQTNLNLSITGSGNIVLSSGEQKRIDSNSDGVNDFAVEYGGYSSGRAEVKIVKLEMSSNTTVVGGVSENTYEDDGSDSEKISGEKIWQIIMFSLSVLIAVIGVLLFLIFRSINKN